MNKDKIIETIRAAKRAHMSWVMKAAALIEGIPLEKEQVPINGTECIFGHWYYGEGQSLSFLPSFKTIEEPHFNLHTTYAKIFTLLFEEPDISLMSRLLGKSKAAKAENVANAKKMFSTLKAHSEVVVLHLEKLEKEVLNYDAGDGMQKVVNIK